MVPADGQDSTRPSIAGQQPVIMRASQPNKSTCAFIIALFFFGLLLLPYLAHT
jgi:hypothetical protein